MTWLNSVRNALSSVYKRETPDNLWHKCKGCGQMVFTKELAENAQVCPRCDHHERIGPKERFRQLLDEVWGPGRSGQVHYIRIYVRQLRQHLEPDPSRPVFLVTETGAGYRLAPDP